MIRRHLVVALAVLLAPAAVASAQPDALLARFAVDLAAERDAAPISLDADASGLHGVAYDRFTRAHLTARAARLRGAPLNPASPPANLLTQALILVAYPLVCAGGMVQPTDVNIDRAGRPIPKSFPATRAAAQPLLPGATVPAGAIAVQFSATVLQPGEVVRISYRASACSGTSTTVSLPVSATSPRALQRPSIEIASGDPTPPGSVTLNLSGVVDLEGRLRYATAPEAATALGAAALAAAMKMPFEPARLNGSPTPWTAGIVLTFGATQAAPTSTEVATPDVASLTEATSQCPVSRDQTYGVTGINPILIGGGADAAAREERYLRELRGPAGQGLHYRAAGPVMRSGRGQAVLDAFEVRHAGLASPMRVYFDPSQEGPLSAPSGFTCAAPLGAK